MNEKVNVGLVGVGRWGPNVIGAINRLGHGQVAKVADPSHQALQRLADRFPSISTSESAEHLIEDSDIDAIAVCTPVETHTSLVRAALLAGKHVFVEKPFGQDYEECSKLCKLAKERRLQIVVGHVFLFNESILHLKDIIQSGDLGEILHLEAHRSNLGPVRKDVNAVWDLTSHDLSIFDFLLGQFPNEVSCLGSCQLDSKNEDTAYTTFKYKNGILAHAQASWLHPLKVRKITVIGSKKMALWDDLNLEHPVTIYDSSIGLEQAYYSDSFASHRLSYNRGDVLMPNIATNEPLLEELRHFLDVVGGAKNDRSSGEYGSELVRTLQAADRSLEKNGTFVPVER